MTKWLLRAMTELTSRKWLSQLTGNFAQSRASRRFIARFARMYGIAVHEAEKELSQYSSLNEFFTRKLKPGMRPIDEGADTLVSPVDALITGAGSITAGTILNVKGQDYTIRELLNSSERGQYYDQGYYLVLYLSPSDYHRIHAPATGRIMEREHVPGKVYPVNDFGLTHMKRVLSRNERLITYIRHSLGEVAVVKVGAMNVSSIRYTGPQEQEASKGGELAYFAFGSTVVLLLQNDTFSPDPALAVGTKVKMGQRLGTLVSG